jgi:hypothetical protein
MGGGALALHVAKITRRRHPTHALPEEVNGYFADMGQLAVELGTSAQEVVLSGDPRRAAELEHEDDAMDELHRHLFTVLMDRDWKHGVAAAVDVTLLGRYYERFADHAVEVGRRVIFQATGETSVEIDSGRHPAWVAPVSNPQVFGEHDVGARRRGLDTAITDRAGRRMKRGCHLPAVIGCPRQESNLRPTD